MITLLKIIVLLMAAAAFQSCQAQIKPPPIPEPNLTITTLVYELGSLRADVWFHFDPPYPHDTIHLEIYNANQSNSVPQSRVTLSAPIDVFTIHNLDINDIHRVRFSFTVEQGEKKCQTVSGYFIAVSGNSTVAERICSDAGKK